MVSERSLLSISQLITELVNFISYQVMQNLNFNNDARIPNNELIKKTESMMNKNLMIFSHVPGNLDLCKVQQLAIVAYDENMDEIRDSDMDDVLVVQDQPSARTDRLLKSVQKYEMKGMEDGWIVNIAEDTCPCLLNLKEGSCVHILGAKMNKRMDIPGWNPPQQQLVNQRVAYNRTRATNRSIRAHNANTARGNPGAMVSRLNGRGRGTRGAMVSRLNVRGRGTRASSALRSRGRGRRVGPALSME